MGRTICIIDDDEAVRSSLRDLFSSQSDLVIRAYASGDVLLREADSLEPAVLLLDIHMPGASGIDVLNATRAMGKFVTVVLTGQGNVDVAVEAMKAGAFDFVEKPFDVETLMQRVADAFLRLESDGSMAARIGAAKKEIAKLSPRERDVLAGLIEGKANKVIGYDLGISPRTVEIYRANLMDKLGVRSLPEVLRVAFAAGLIQD
nr:response regulator [Sphingomonas soli]